MLTRPEIKGERRADGVVAEINGGEKREAAEEAGERPSNARVGEIDRDDPVERVAEDPGPVAGQLVSGFPGGENPGRVFEPFFHFEEIKAFLV